jgi:hypothetical protein
VILDWYLAESDEAIDAMLVCSAFARGRLTETEILDVLNCFGKNSNTSKLYVEELLSREARS